MYKSLKSSGLIYRQIIPQTRDMLFISKTNNQTECIYINIKINEHLAFSMAVLWFGTQGSGGDVYSHG